jgi:hypothetical protein
VINVRCRIGDLCPGCDRKTFLPDPNVHVGAGLSPW